MNRTLPALPLLLAVLAGICIAIGDWLAILIAIVLFVASIICLIPKHRLAQVIVCLTFLALAWWNTSASIPPRNIDLSGRYCTAVVTVIESEMRTNGYTLVSDIDTIRTKDKILVHPGIRAKLTVLSHEHILNPGDVIRVKGKYTSVYATDFQDKRAYASYLLSNSISALMVSYQAAQVLDSHPSFLQRLQIRSNATIENAIVDTGFNNSTTAFLLGVLAGDTWLMDTDVVENYRSAGIAHILALSGMHVAILLGLFFALVMPMRLVRGGRTLSFVLASILLSVYAISVGCTPSVVRASITAILTMLVLWVERPVNVLNILCATLLLILCVKPMWIFSVGLQLSTLALLGIFVVYLPLYHRSKHWGRPFRYTLPVILTLSAYITTMPAALIYFDHLPLWFIPANILASALVAPIITCGMVAILLNAVSLPAELFVGFTDFLVEILDNGIMLFS